MDFNPGSGRETKEAATTMKQKSKGKQKLPTTPEAIHARIWAIDTKTMGKMGAGEFALLLDKANYEDRRHLEYLLSRFQTEGLVRRVVKEEFAKAKSGRGNK